MKKVSGPVSACCEKTFSLPPGVGKRSHAEKGYDVIPLSLSTEEDQAEPRCRLRQGGWWGQGQMYCSGCYLMRHGADTRPHDILSEA